MMWPFRHALWSAPRNRLRSRAGPTANLSWRSGKPFWQSTHLLGTPAFAHGVDQLDAVGVNDAEHGRSGQEDLCPVLMGPEEAKQAGPLGEPGKQRPIVTCQPAIKRPVADAFERMQV